MERKKGNIDWMMLLGILLMPFIIQQLDFVKIKPLKGYIREEKDSALNVNNWFSGKYQEQHEKYLQSHLKIRPFLVKLNNQIKFLIQKDISAANVVIGKQGYFYERHYIWTHFGLDFSGEDVIHEKVVHAKRVVDSLEKNGVRFLLVLAPGKAEVLPEYIPEDQIVEKRNPSNYEVYSSYFQHSGIHWIDFNSYFKRLKDTISYPLYSKGGTHWSIYGSYIAIDTIMIYMEYLLKKDLPDYQYPVYDITRKPRGTDKDIANACNLLWYHFDENLYYPYLQIKNNRQGYKPKVIIVGDSYYWTIVNNGVQKVLFDSFYFWYYFKENHSNNPKMPKEVDRIINLRNFIENQDIILFVITDGNLREFSWNFFETLEKLYGIN